MAASQARFKQPVGNVWFEKAEPARCAETGLMMNRWAMTAIGNVTSLEGLVPEFASPPRPDGRNLQVKN